jgi:hypothetical protein
VSSQSVPLSRLIVIDDQRDEVRIKGARVSGEVFRQFATPTPPGQWYRTVKVGHVIVVETKKDAS